MTRRYADDSSAIRDGAKNGFRPTEFGITLHGADARVVLPRGVAPGVDVRGESLREQNDGIAFPDRYVGGRDGHAIADGGDQCDGVRARAQNVAGQRAKLFGGGEPVLAG